MENSRLIELMNKYTSETLTHHEGRELADMLGQQEHQQQFQELLLQQISSEALNIDTENERSFKHIEQKIIQQINASEPQSPVISLWLKKWLPYAAVFILCLGTGAYLWNSSGPSVKTAGTASLPPSTILPGTNKAILVLGDESVLNLDEISPGQSIAQGNVQIVKSADGELIYTPAASDNNNEGIFINTMKTPNGGQYQLTLPDGTQAWLNAASSITYPTRFTGNKRQVKVSGEIYLEVAKNKSAPFIVNTGQQEIIVLGTAFNINNYPGERVRFRW